MPHKSKILKLGEKIASMYLPSLFPWKKTLLKINNVNAHFDLPNVWGNGHTNIQLVSFLKYASKACGDRFA